MSNRPSKRFLFRILRRDINLYSNVDSIVIDAACNNGRSRPMFPSKNYIGIDMSKDELKACMANYKDVTAGYADLTDTSLPESSVDLCVTTNTLEWMSKDGQILAVKSMASAVKSNGVYLLNKHRDDAFLPILDILHDYFDKVEVIYYRNPLSKYYENFISKNGHIITEGAMVGKLARLLLSYLMSYCEWLTTWVPAINEAAYIRCSNKKSTGIETDIYASLKAENGIFVFNSAVNE